MVHCDGVGASVKEVEVRGPEKARLMKLRSQSAIASRGEGPADCRRLLLRLGRPIELTRIPIIPITIIKGIARITIVKIGERSTSGPGPAIPYLPKH